MVTGKKVVVGPEAVKKFAGLASDSREVKAGFLFAAIPGTKGDGASFVGDAVARGAVAVLGKPEIAGAVKAAGVAFIPAENGPSTAASDGSKSGFGDAGSSSRPVMRAS